MIRNIQTALQLIEFSLEKNVLNECIGRYKWNEIDVVYNSAEMFEMHVKSLK